MASYSSFFRNTPNGTLGTNGLYQQPGSAGTNLPQGTNFSDGRAYTRNVNSNELVANQLQGLLDPNNPYLRQGMNRANRAAANAGMGRSSIAIGNAQAALVDRALPIAQQDASTYAQAAGQNQDALNTNLGQERDIRNQILMQQQQIAAGDRSSAANLAAQRYAQDMQLQLQREGLAFQGEQNQLNRLHDFQTTAQGYMFDIGRMNNDFQNRDRLASNDTFRQDWLADRNFGRQINSNIISAGIGSMTGMYQYLTQSAIDNPDVYDPEAYSGMMNFFQSQWGQMFANLFGGG